MNSKDEIEVDFNVIIDRLDERGKVIVEEDNGKILAPIKYLKEVSVPAKRSPDVQQCASRNASHRASSVSSVFSSLHDLSMDHDTPSTSVAVTPAELDKRTRRGLPLSKSKYDTSVRKSSDRITTHQQMRSSTGKRKRDSQIEAEKDSLGSDERLARKLQVEEYAGSSAQQSGATTGRKLGIEDSEDLYSLSELSSDDELEDLGRASFNDSDCKKVKKIKTSGRLQLPSRAARDSARQSIADKTSLGILDEDDEDDFLLSDYISEEDSIFEADIDDELVDNILDQEDLNTAATVTAAPSTLPSRARARARRRLRVPRIAAISNRESHQDVWTSRVS